MDTKGDTMYIEAIKQINQRFSKAHKHSKLNYIARAKALELLRHKELSPEELGDAFELILKELVEQQHKKEKVEYQINDSLFYDVEIGADEAP